LGRCCSPFILARKEPTTLKPPKGPFDDPSTWENNETAHIIRALDDFDVNTLPMGHFLNSITSIATISPDFFEVGVETCGAFQQWTSGVTILHTSARHQNHEKQSDRVNDNVALAPFGLLGRIESRAFRLDGSLRGLAIHDACRGFVGTAFHLTDGVTKRVVNDFEIAPLRPLRICIVDGVPRRQVMREHSPRASRANSVKDRVHDLATIVARCLKVRKLDRRWYQLSENSPLGIRQVARIRASAARRRGARRHATGRSRRPLGSKFPTFSVE